MIGPTVCRGATDEVLAGGPAAPALRLAAAERLSAGTGRPGRHSVTVT